jgi:hypothetical protein
VIHIIPHENSSMVIYKGRLTEPDSGGGFDNPALVVNGQLVPYDELDAWYTERMLFDWRGQPFHLDTYRNGRVYGGYLGYDSGWAREQGLEGSQYDGWMCDAPESEIENLRIEKIDILERWRYRKTFAVEPPKDLFVDVRPATDQEWIRA